MHVPDSANIVGGLYTLGPPRSVIGRHILNALVYEVLGVLTAGGVTPRANGAADAAASYTNQLRDAIIAIANARFAALHPAAFTSALLAAFQDQFDAALNDAMDNNASFETWVETLSDARFAALHPAAFTAAFLAAFQDAFDASLNDAMDNNATFATWVEALADAQIAAAETTGSFTCELRSSDGLIQSGTATWMKRGSFVHLTLPLLVGTGAAVATDTHLTLTGAAGADFPAGLISSAQSQDAPVRLRIDSGGAAYEWGYLHYNATEDSLRIFRPSNALFPGASNTLGIQKTLFVYEIVP